MEANEGANMSTDTERLWVVGTPEGGRYRWLRTYRHGLSLLTHWTDDLTVARTFPTKADAESFAGDSTSRRTVAMRLVGARIASATADMVAPS